MSRFIGCGTGFQTEPPPTHAPDRWRPTVTTVTHATDPDPDPATVQTPTQLVEAVLARVAAMPAPIAVPPGPEWMFARGALFALGTTGQCAAAEIAAYETPSAGPRARHLRGTTRPRTADDHTHQAPGPS